MADDLVTESQLDDATQPQQAAPSPMRQPGQQQPDFMQKVVQSTMWSPADSQREKALQSQLQTVQGQDAAAMKEYMGGREQFTKNMQTDIQGIRGAQDQMSADIQANRQQQPTQFPQAPSGPVVDPEAFKSFFGPALIFSMILGKVAKADMVDGLNMLSSSINGFVMGSKEKAAADMQQFKAKMESAVNTEQARISKYRETMADDKLNIQQKMDRMSIDAWADEDKRMMLALQRADYKDTINTILKQEQLMEKHKENTVKIWTAMQKGQQAMEAADEGLVDEVGTYRADPAKLVGMAKRRREALMKRVAEKYPGYDATQFTAKNTAMRASGLREANIGFTTNELDGFVQNAVNASRNVSRTGWMPLNQVIQLGTAGWSPEQAAFVAANKAVINTFAALSTRSGNSTVHSMQEAEKMLSTAQTPEMYEATARMLIKEGYTAMRAAEKTREQIMGKQHKQTESGTGGERSIDVIGGHTPYSDPEKERRYQEYLRAHPE